MFGFGTTAAAGGLGDELIENSDFRTDIAGFSPRADSTASWSASEGYEGYIGSGGGGGFIYTPTLTLTVGATYRCSICIEGSGYTGGFKVRVGDVEVELVDAITQDSDIYTVDVVAKSSNTLFEFFRNGGIGSYYLGEVSIKEVLE